MPDSGPVTVRAYRDGDEAAILDLFARCFPHAPRGVDHFRWKYLQNPAGDRRISLAFDGEQRLVGHYSGYAVPWQLNGRDLAAHQIGDTMTDVSVRHLGRGPTSVLGRTALDFYSRFCEGRVGFNYGFNVANIQRFSLRFLRSDRVEPVTYRVRDLVRDPLRPLGRFDRWTRGLHFELAGGTGKEWDDLFHRAARHYRFLVRRDAPYVQWRYLDCPDTRYFVVAVRKWGMLAGWIAFRIDGDRFLWGDALFDPELPEAMEATLRHVVPGYPVRTVEGWFSSRPAWFGAFLAAQHFESRQEPQDLSVMCVPFELRDAVPQMREQMYYTWGDSDLF